MFAGATCSQSMLPPALLTSFWDLKKFRHLNIWKIPQKCWNLSQSQVYVHLVLRAGGRGLFDFCVFVVYWYFILFVSWRQGCFRDQRRSSMRIYFWTLAHERSGLSYHSSDMFYVSSWRSWRFQARCTIPFFFSFFIFKGKIQLFL